MATMQIGALVVDLIAESAQYIRGLQQANEATESWSGNVTKSFNAVAKNIAAMAAGYLGLSAAISAANNAMASAREIENLSRLAGQSVEEFQASAYAVEQYGISTEKLGDISKDTSDKLGDFIATGGGEFADFFEQVAPQVGLTAAELQNLSGPDVLLKVKQAMDDANVPMKQQIFYLESIANDASLLIPVLENNGQKLRELTAEYDSMNVAMSETDIQNIRRMEKSLADADRQAKALSNTLLVSVSESISSVANYFAEIMAELNQQINAGPRKALAFELAELEIQHAKLANSIANVEGALDDADAAERAQILNYSEIARNLDENKQKLEAYAQEIIRVSNELEAMDAQDIQLPEPPSLDPFTLSGTVSYASSLSTDEDPDAVFAAKQQAILDSLTSSIGTQEDLLRQSYVKQLNMINSLILSEGQVRAAGYETLEALQADYLKKAEAGYNESLNKLDEASASSFTGLADTFGTTTETMERAATGWTNSFGNELASMVTTGELDFARLAESIINDLIRIAIQAQITQPLLEAMGLATPAASTGTGTTTEATGKATGGSVMRGTTYLVGEQGPELFTASNSGSIIPNDQLSGGNATVNVYTQPGETAETSTTTTPEGDVVEIFMKQVDSRMNEQVSRGQGLARTLESRYSLSRKSY